LEADQAVVAVRSRSALATPAAYDGGLRVGVEIRVRLLDPARLHLAVSVEELHELDSRPHLDEPNEARVARQRRGEWRRGFQVDQLPAGGPRDGDAVTLRPPLPPDDPPHPPPPPRPPPPHP